MANKDRECRVRNPWKPEKPVLHTKERAAMGRAEQTKLPSQENATRPNHETDLMIGDSINSRNMVGI